MTCAWAFAVLALISLPAAVHHGPAAVVTWLAQTFLQLVLLSVILHGQNELARVADERDEASHVLLARIAAQLGVDPP
jgi:hypothetical protein